MPGVIFTESEAARTQRAVEWFESKPARSLPPLKRPYRDPGVPDDSDTDDLVSGGPCGSCTFANSVGGVDATIGGETVKLPAAFIVGGLGKLGPYWGVPRLILHYDDDGEYVLLRPYGDHDERELLERSCEDEE